jgi:hypothetical protein
MGSQNFFPDATLFVNGLRRFLPIVREPDFLDYVSLNPGYIGRRSDAEERARG